MTPYYQHDGITIYHGDCRDVLPTLPDVDLVLTDPPWKMDTPIMEGGEDPWALWAEVAPMLRAARLLLWLGITQDPRPWLSPLDGWPFLRTIIIRRAIPGFYGRSLIDGEVIYALGSWPKMRKGAHTIPGGMSITYRSNDRINGHPGPRSLIATRWLETWWSEGAGIVLDPFMGTGTTLRAAKDLGLPAIGVEVEERYCEMAALRLSQQALALETSPALH